ncbi:MAG: glycosyltransferase family 2 protein [Deltaproteobacteria bacterium]
MPKISVVVPAYNSARYLAEAVESVIAQTFADWEATVVDDGSTDNTREVLAPYLDRINYIYQQNAGPGRARNTGIEASTGKYIAFMDADDVWTADKLQIQSDFLDANPDVHFIFANDFVVSQDGGLLYTGHPKWECIYEIPQVSLGGTNKKFTHSIFAALIRHSFIPTSTVVVRRECLDDAGYFDEGILNGQDLELWWRLSRRYNAGFTDLHLSKYRVHSSNFSADSERKFTNALRLMRTLAAYPDIDAETAALINRRFARTHFEFGYFYFARDNMPSAREQFLLSLRYRPASPKTLALLAGSCLPSSAVKALRRIRNIMGGNSNSNSRKIKSTTP